MIPEAPYPHHSGETRCVYSKKHKPAYNGAYLSCGIEILIELPEADRFYFYAFSTRLALQEKDTALYLPSLSHPVAAVSHFPCSGEFIT